jgi:alpha-tubulin suppressor-like RCC1 family protein
MKKLNFQNMLNNQMNPKLVINQKFGWLVVMLISIYQAAYSQKIANGGWHTLVVCEDSTVKAFGENASGQLGNNSTDDSNVPVTAIGLNGVIAVSAGGDQLEAHSMALKNDGTVWTWGSNLYGALGNGLSGTQNNSSTPIQVLVINNVKAISAGGWHSVALKQDGTVWTWGWNDDGQIGDGSNTNKTIPTQVPNLNNVVQIAAGSYHNLALKNDGTVWAWGDNLYGQLGDGSNSDKNTPVQVLGLNNVVQIASGRFFSMAVKSDGTLWAWGQNLYGQLGDNTTNDKNTPIQVQGIDNVSTLIACGAFHTIAIKNDGTVWTWGRNTYGNLGNNTVNNSSIPIQLTDVSNVQGVAAGTNFTTLFKNDGTFWGCGRNASGQLGDGTFLQRNTFIQSTAVCKIQSVLTSQKKPLQSFYTVFPNPSHQGIFFLNFKEFPKTSEPIQIFVYNSLGQVIYEKILQPYDYSETIKIDLSNQTSGFYILQVLTQDTKHFCKLVKP